jgi:hypothetical protein
MEIDRVQQVTGLKVERTGSESERRRHERPDQEFGSLLDQSLKDEPGEQPPDGGLPGQRPHAFRPDQPLARDTVSLTSSKPPAAQPAPDTVSISTAALVGSESDKARSSTLKLSLVQRVIQGLRGTARPAARGPGDAAAGQAGGETKHSPLDTVA